MTNQERATQPPEEVSVHQTDTVVRGCRFCGAPLHDTFVDLGMSPLCESFLDESALNQMEPFYPLHVYVCHQCFLVQLQEYVSPEEIFREYAYYSSYSETWLEHARRYTEQILGHLGLTATSSVVEIASNDGYLLHYFRERGIPVLGVEPARNVAQVALQKGIPTVMEFFGTELASRLTADGQAADLLIGNNVLAQVPDLNDFVAGMKILLKPAGVMTLEFPHLMRLVEGNQFDTIYHEHFSYFSFLSVQAIFAAHGLALYDVEEIPTHGGSLRIYVRHDTDATKPTSSRVSALLARERAAGVETLEYYAAFEEQVRETKRELLRFLIAATGAGEAVVGYGAPGKGNTLLNYCGIRTDFLEYTVDRNPYKQGKYLPGSHIPIYDPEKIMATRPDYVLILPWNLKDEIMSQMAHILEWGGRFIVPIPTTRVYP
jgi:2-polyprenyl-3-methyl-5-hydroxy-6-metoxy-1,4-benzoquinol methylase